MSIPKRQPPSRSPRRAPRHKALTVLLVGLSGCLDYNPFAKGDKDPSDHPDSPVDPDSTVWPQLIEICDGLDNDGNGAADEGFEDVDGNGVKDCLECDATLESEAVLEIRDDCGPNLSVDDPWNVVVEWEVTGLDGLLVPPVVGDLDRDGVPELVLVSTYARMPSLYALQGTDGALEWSLPWESHPYMATAIADTTGDGSLEIVAHLGQFNVVPVLLDHTGTRQWTAHTSSDAWSFCIPLIADLEGDGRLELLTGDKVYDLDTGAILATFPWVNNEQSIPAIGDIDLDGYQEFVRHGCVFDHEYQLRWCVEDWEQSFVSSSALLQHDSDPEAEVLFLSDRMRVLDADGAVLVDVDLVADDEVNVSAPSIADFDGDGQVEIALALRANLQLRELDGTLRWSRELVDPSNGLLGFVGFDFDTDGAHELVVTDTENLYIIDGSTGAILFTETRHRTGTILDHPLVVDVDADGAAEIVLASWHPDEDDVSLRVFGHVDNAWPSTGTHWPSYDFQVTNIREDGSLCTEQPYPWQEWNMYRARPAAGGPRPNHTIVLNDACGGTCKDAGFIEVSFQVGNDGIRAALAGAEVSLYRVNGDQRVLLDQTTTASELAPGTLGASQTLRASVSDVRGATLQLEVVGDPLRPECDGEDDVVSFDSPC